MPHPIREILVETADPVPLVPFWSELLQHPPAGADAVPLADEAALRFVTTDQPKRVKNRLHLDLASTSADHQDQLVGTARDLGATPVDVGQRDVPWVVLADPGGNEFCVLEPREEYLGLGPVAAVIIDALDPVAQVRFWSQLTGLAVTREDPVFATLRRPSRFFVEFIRVDQAKTVRNRLHLVLAGGGLPAADPEGNEILSR